MGAIPEGDHSSSLYSDKLKEYHINMLQEVIDDSFLRHALVRSYTRSFNAFAAYLKEEERQKLASYDEVISIFPSRTLRPETTRSWDFMGLKENVNRISTAGSNVIIGVLDTGIWPESTSFSDKGFGPIPKKWKGVCHGGKKFTCNKKLIGARYYTNNFEDADSARDTDGHGTHTASIAAGNYVKDASFYGIAQGTARGGVPSARIAAYKVCYVDGRCNETDVLSAFDDAIADGVDIITVSMGTKEARNLSSNSIAIGALHAFQKGILTVHSGGNNGFRSATVTSVDPWLLTVAASTTDRGIITKVSLGNGRTILGKSVNSFKMNGTKFPLVYGKEVTSRCGEKAAKYINIYHPFFKPYLISGKIVLCDKERGIYNALNAGAIGSIAEIDSVHDYSSSVPLPASSLSIDDMRLVRNYIYFTKSPEAYISTSESTKNRDAPLVASFSSRGPNRVIPEILKPDLTAPGVEILAAYPPAARLFKDKRSVKFNILSGTSMSCPHAAGAAAYVKSVHPDWSPSAIKSALMTTAWQMDATKHKDAEFSYGAGHINPVNATNPGLVYETSRNEYIKMLCNMGYTKKVVRKLFGDRRITCPKQQRGRVTGKDLNYPSMTYQINIDAPFSVKFSRTVTNVGTDKSTYKAKITKNTDCNITMEPSTLYFKELNEKKSFVLTVKGDQIKKMISASLVWSDGIHFVRSPIVVYGN
ncbi:hypothetical protein RD792_012523 [Penstemon davidsonii]|uniref:Cucumisin n=1 Tax=Penstemon davidsonii TaxID=160366 RepID=A0ABR0CXW2_9LAMI|nr:hypothetical protein RD792_012523 [Penstemon davidsonii]